MKTTCFITFFLALFLPFAVIPQPGYMGKRFQAGYGLSFSPALVGSNGAGNSFNGRDGSNAETGEPAFNSLHEGFIEYCIKNRTMIGFSGKFYKTTYDNRAEMRYQNYYDPNSVYYGANNEYAKPQGLYTIKGINYTLYFKFYHRKYLAPWGKYFLLGPSFNSFVCTYDPTKMYAVSSGVSPDVARRNNNFGPQGQDFQRFDILVGFGRNRIFADRITVDYGINFEAFALLLAVLDIEGSGSFSNSATTNLNYIEYTCKSRVREVNRVNLYFKIGYLLF